jgi:hypothetical protein
MDGVQDILAYLSPSLTLGAQVERLGEQTWRLSIPPGPARRYRLAQLDDYGQASRRAFPWKPPFDLALQARASATELPGTWGFGLWNDPFGMGILGGGEKLRLPALPNTAWFFFASPPNYLSVRDDLPAQSGLATTFCAPRWPPLLLALATPGLPLLALPPAVRLLRRLARRIIRQDAVSLHIDPMDWHAYHLEWTIQHVNFQVDGKTILQTTTVPHSPLGLVLWVDNQYMAITPAGRVRYGTLPNPEPAWIEIRNLELSPPRRTALDKHPTTR